MHPSPIVAHETRCRETSRTLASNTAFFSTPLRRADDKVAPASRRSNQARPRAALHTWVLPRQGTSTRTPLSAPEASVHVTPTSHSRHPRARATRPRTNGSASPSRKTPPHLHHVPRHSEPDCHFEHRPLYQLRGTGRAVTTGCKTLTRACIPGTAPTSRATLRRVRHLRRHPLTTTRITPRRRETPMSSG